MLGEVRRRCTGLEKTVAPRARPRLPATPAPGPMCSVGAPPPAQVAWIGDTTNKTLRTSAPSATSGSLKGGGSTSQGMGDIEERPAALEARWSVIETDAGADLQRTMAKLQEEASQHGHRGRGGGSGGSRVSGSAAGVSCKTPAGLERARFAIRAVHMSLGSRLRVWLAAFRTASEAASALTLHWAHEFSREVLVRNGTAPDHIAENIGASPSRLPKSSTPSSPRACSTSRRSAPRRRPRARGDSSSA